MKRVQKRLKAGVHVLPLPIIETTSVEALFPKEISGSMIEKLDSTGEWMQQESIVYLNNAFVVSSLYKTFSPFDVVRLDLKRDVVIDWEVDFKSRSGLKEHTLDNDAGFSWEEALYLAQLSSLVYKDEESITKTIHEQYHFDQFYYFSKQSHRRLFSNALNTLLYTFFRGKRSIVDLQFMYLEKAATKNTKQIITVVFRGSQEVADWMTNFNIHDEGFFERGRVHQGFYTALKLFFQSIKKQDVILSEEIRKITSGTIEALNEKTTIILVGHSLGGALATLAGCYLRELGIKKESLQVYTFGAPPVGTREFCDYFKDTFALYRLVNEKDVVPKLDQWTQFFHFGDEIIMPSNQGEIHAIEGYIDNIIDAIDK